MLNNFFNINLDEKKTLPLLSIILLYFFPISAYSQSPTNLEVFYSLTDSLTGKITNEIPAEQKRILLTLNLGESYSLFANQLKSGFTNRGKQIIDIPPDEINIQQVNIVLENANVEYGKMFRDGWFGSYYVERVCIIKGNYLQSFSSNGKQDFEISFSDTVLVDDIENLENNSFPFTKGVLPAEPFLSGLAESIIAVVTAAAAVILFFTIRSK